MNNYRQKNNSIINWNFISCLLILSFFSLTSALAEVSRIEKKSELIDFQSIREILRSDNLDEQAREKEDEVKTLSKEREERIIRSYDIPKEDQFYRFFSEYWLVKNVTLLKWDFRKPDYGIEGAFKKLLTELGHFDITFRILLLDSSNISHGYLPSENKHYIFLLSVPFIRSMDLTLREIAVLLYENFVRAERRLFEGKVVFDELQNIWGGNFHGETFDQNIIKKMTRNYDRVLFEEGYTFQEQFEVTKQMDNILRSRPQYWNSYYKLIEKIDTLVKTNILYSQYPSLFPSPELQQGWLKPSSQRSRR